MSSRVRVLFYAINGSGMGHLTRLLAIGRAMRHLLEAMEVKFDLRFLTTSEATTAVWDFPTYKLPSHTVVAAAGLDRQRFIADSRLLAINLTASLSPDVLVTDTVPHGAFGEMAFLKGHARAAVYIDRHKDLSVSESELHRRHLPLYDKILVPDDEDQAHRYPLSAELTSRRRFSGCIHGYRGDQAWSSQKVRDYFGIAPERRVIFVGAGGGGDSASRGSLHHLIEALRADPALHLLVGYGPLHQGDCLYGANLTPLRETEISRYFAGIDAAVSAAGYNSYQELLAAGVPTVFFAQPKGMDRQDERIRIGLERRWHSSFTSDGSPVELSELEPALLLARVHGVMQGELRGTILQALRERPRAEGALRAATEILALHAAQTGSPIKRGVLFQTALERQAQGDAPESFVDCLKALRYWRKAAWTADVQAEHEEAARHSWRHPDASRLAEVARDLRWGRRLAALSEPARLARNWCYQGPGDEAQEKEARMRLEEALDSLQSRVGVDVTDRLLLALRASHKGPALREAVAGLVALADSPESDLQEILGRVPGEREEVI